jgi:15-cis-phytoene synthase
MQSTLDHCAALVREADKDRYLAALFAPAEHRNALFALYAFDAEIARVRGLAREPMPGEMRLQWWREVLVGEREGETAAHPVAAALRDALARHRIDVALLIALIDAQSFDLYDEPMANRDDLETYAVATRGAVFAIAANILGSRAPAARALARHAGIAHTIASVLSGLRLHASRRQLYLPIDVLARNNVEREDIFAGHATPELSAALAELRLYACRHLDAAQEELPGVPEAVLPALLPAALVRPILQRMKRRSYDPFNPQPLPAWRRQWLLWRAARHPRQMLGP